MPIGHPHCGGFHYFQSYTTNTVENARYTATVILPRDGDIPASGTSLAVSAQRTVLVSRYDLVLAETTDIWYLSLSVDGVLWRNIE